MKELEKEIRLILNRNKEELIHAKNTLKWLLVLNKEADPILRISALGHDIERALYGKDKKKYSSHKEFKIEHSKRSTEILKNLLIKFNTDEEDIQRMKNIVNNHEFGGDKEANLIKDADSLANMQRCDEMLGKVDSKSLKETMKRMVERMEDHNKIFLKQIKFQHKEVKEWFREITKVQT